MSDVSESLDGLVWENDSAASMDSYSSNIDESAYETDSDSFQLKFQGLILIRLE
ncbi:hypothetical protein HOY80DRAFT_1045474 [Tuber brumale]|nr:hypothetical protein HOY80DRAFT_1045474 [Tuber brumale]